MYMETLVEKARAYPGIAQKVQDFKKFKSENPLQAFGTRDKPFMGNQIYGTTIPDLRHAHFNLDLMIVYTIRGRNPIEFDLYGIFSHDELGIGQPANVRKQRSMSSRMANQQFGSKDTEELPATTATGNKFTQGKGGKVDYSPKPKAPTPAQAAQEKIRDPFFGFVKMVDEVWPDRNLFRQMQATRDIYERIQLINKEAQYLMLVKQKNRLYPNQLEYLKGLEGLVNYLKSQQKR